MVHESIVLSGEDRVNQVVHGRWAGEVGVPAPEHVEAGAAIAVRRYYSNHVRVVQGGRHEVADHGQKARPQSSLDSKERGVAL